MTDTQLSRLKRIPRSFLTRLEKKHSKGKALTILAHKLARAIYYMLKRQTAFDVDTFLRG